MSKSLYEAKVCYLPLEKVILAIMLSTWKLPHYFQAIPRSADYTGRVAKWSTILGAFDIKYMPCTSVKGQVLVDLVAEFTETPVEELKLAENMDEKSVGMVSQRGPSP